MSDTPLLVDARWLSQHPEVRVVDLRWSLAGPPHRQKYDQGHIPGAVYVDMEADLSQHGGPGRHPFPPPETFLRALSRAGIGEDTHVVVYDDMGGSNAARLWFMLRAYGHEKASLLDGGFKAWVEAGLPLTREEPHVAPAPLRKLALDRSRVVDREQVLKRGESALLDARAPERYRGEVEPVDPRAGHIPGAINVPWASNLNAAGRFKPPEELYQVYTRYTSPIVSCGSGVTACHDAFAMELAGLPPARLYVGSWSDWCSDPSRPIATGAEPG